MSRKTLKSYLRDLPGILTGRKQDRHNTGYQFKLRLAVDLFRIIAEQFHVKSDGKTDSAGYRWKPLAKSTIAARPIRPGEKRALGIGGFRTRGLLTATQDRKWKEIFGTRLAALLAKGVPEGKAKIIAAKIAWAVVKSMGAKTRLETLGNRKVPIGIDTSRLIDSLTPGTLAAFAYQKPAEQIFVSHRDSIDLGTRVPYAGRFHAVRRLWPSRERIGPWVSEAARTAVNGILPLLGNKQ